MVTGDRQRAHFALAYGHRHGDDHGRCHSLSSEGSGRCHYYHYYYVRGSNRGKARTSPLLFFDVGRSFRGNGIGWELILLCRPFQKFSPYPSRLLYTPGNYDGFLVVSLPLFEVPRFRLGLVRMRSSECLFYATPLYSMGNT